MPFMKAGSDPGHPISDEHIQSILNFFGLLIIGMLIEKYDDLLDVMIRLVDTENGRKTLRDSPQLGLHLAIRGAG